jgi:hypothetical protein
MNVFILYYVAPKDGGHWYGKFLGVYSLQREAAFAVERLQGRSGYYYPRGFQIECIEVDKEYDGSVHMGPVPPDLLPPPYWPGH